MINDTLLVFKKDQFLNYIIWRMLGLFAKAKKCFFRRFKRNINWRGKWKAGGVTWTGKIEGEKEGEKMVRVWDQASTFRRRSDKPFFIPNLMVQFIWILCAASRTGGKSVSDENIYKHGTYKNKCITFWYECRRYIRTSSPFCFLVSRWNDWNLPDNIAYTVYSRVIWEMPGTVAIGRTR